MRIVSICSNLFKTVGLLTVRLNAQNSRSFSCRLWY